MATSHDPTSLKPFLTTLSFPSPDVDLLDEFHAATKVTRESIATDAVWISGYLTDPRAILETGSNAKRFFLSEKIALPAPTPYEESLASALRRRASTKTFSAQGISAAELSSLLHGACGATRVSIVDPARDLRIHHRPYASGGGLYPIEIYPLLLRVDGLEPMVTHYDPVRNSLTVLRRCADPVEMLEPLSDFDGQLARAAIVVLTTAVLPRTTVKYASRGYRFALLEAGEAAQNLSLCAEAAALGTLPWGGYFDDEVATLLKINGVDETVVHCLAIGHPS
jgi:SagB-type dehydrogenase family enzyme